MELPWRTDPSYLADVERRIEAGTLLWARDVDADYQSASITTFVGRTRLRLEGELAALGLSTSSTTDVIDA